MKKLVIKGAIIGAIITLVIVIHFVNYPKYSCIEAPVGQPTNCNSIVDVTPGLILGSFVTCVVIGGVIGGIYGRKRLCMTVK
jgi:hypothetical protein